MQKFIEEYQTYNTPSEIRSECNAITFINTGTSNVQINGINLTPGQQLISEGNEGEFNATRRHFTIYRYNNGRTNKRVRIIAVYIYNAGEFWTVGILY
ncbi:MAG: hypothetical protein EBX40_01190 [Gammaproteobacteria bacterium]|nr:hypothetical protein [Gammaproteobacteria bacterium]